jgi:hypothetical protein
LGQIFKASDIVEVNEKRNILVESTYVGHLGNHKDFIPKMEYYLVSVEKLYLQFSISIPKEYTLQDWLGFG